MKHLVITATLFLLIWGTETGPVSADDSSITVYANGATLYWRLSGSFDHKHLTVAGSGTHSVREFTNFESVTFVASDRSGMPLPDGQYNWELTAANDVNSGVSVQLEEAVKRGGQGAYAEAYARLARSGQIELPVRYTGQFQIQNGRPLITETDEVDTAEHSHTHNH